MYPPLCEVCNFVADYVRRTTGDVYQNTSYSGWENTPGVNFADWNNFSSGNQFNAFVSYIDPGGSSGGGGDPGFGHPLLNITKTTLINGKLVPVEYGFKPSVAYLLSIISGVSYNDIIATAVTFKSIGVGALTTGNSSISGTITNFDVNFNDIIGFLALMSHEVGHLPQLNDAGGNLTHLSRSGWGYVKSSIRNRSLSYEDYHDKAPLEVAADKGYYNFKDFNKFVDNNIGKNKLELLFKNKVSDENEKLHIIQKWFKAYINDVYGKNNYK